MRPSRASTPSIPPTRIPRSCFNTATPAVWSALWGGETQILPKHIYAGTDPLTSPWNAKPIGNGPFIFREWARGSHVTLERNQNYWDKGADGQAKPFLDKVLFRFIPDAGAREASLENGELQFAATDAVPVADLPGLARDRSLVIDTKSWEALAPIAFLDFNMRRKTFQDIRVRRAIAIAHAIDRDALAKIVWFGYATPATGPIPSYQTKFYKPGLPQYPYDPKQAEALLDAAGLKPGAGGIRLSINNLPLPFGDQYVRTAEFIRDQLRRVGIELKLVNYDLPTFGIKAYRDYDFDALTNWYSAFPDPQLGVIRRYWSRAIKPGTISSNASGWSSPEVDRVIEAMQVETDPLKRRAQIDQLQVIAQTEVPSVNLLEPKFFSIRSARVRATRAARALRISRSRAYGSRRRRRARPAIHRSGLFTRRLQTPFQGKTLMGKIDSNVHAQAVAPGSPALRELIEAIAAGASARDRGEADTHDAIALVRAARSGSSGFRHRSAEPELRCRNCSNSCSSSPRRIPTFPTSCAITSPSWKRPCGRTTARTMRDGSDSSARAGSPVPGRANWAPRISATATVRPVSSQRATTSC